MKRCVNCGDLVVSSYCGSNRCKVCGSYIFTAYDNDEQFVELVDNGYYGWPESMHIDAIWALHHSVDRAAAYLESGIYSCDNIYPTWMYEFNTVELLYYNANHLSGIRYKYAEFSPRINGHAIRVITSGIYRGMFIHEDEADCYIGPFCTYDDAKESLDKYVEWLEYGDVVYDRSDLDDPDGSIAERDYQYPNMDFSCIEEDPDYEVYRCRCCNGYTVVKKGDVVKCRHCDGLYECPF